MKHKLGSKVYFYEFGHTGNKFVGVVSGVIENFDGSYTVSVKTHKYGLNNIEDMQKGVLVTEWEMSSDFVYIINY